MNGQALARVVVESQKWLDVTGGTRQLWFDVADGTSRQVVAFTDDVETIVKYYKFSWPNAQPKEELAKRTIRRDDHVVEWGCFLDEISARDGAELAKLVEAGGFPFAINSKEEVTPTHWASTLMPGRAFSWRGYTFLRSVEDELTWRSKDESVVMRLTCVNQDGESVWVAGWEGRSDSVVVDQIDVNTKAAGFAALAQLLSRTRTEYVRGVWPSGSEPWFFD